MIAKEEQAIQNIIEALALVCPIEEISDYHKDSIEKLVHHFREYGESKNPAFFPSFTEYIQVDVQENIIKHIELDVIENKISYLYKQDLDKSEYERGVMSAIRLIQHRIHSILD